jgi:hypothetical protein
MSCAACFHRLQALKAEVAARPGLLQASVFGYDDILKQLHPFLRSWRAAAAVDPGLQPYLVCADVSRAFDSGGGRVK